MTPEFNEFPQVKINVLNSAIIDVIQIILVYNSTRYNEIWFKYNK